MNRWPSVVLLLAGIYNLIWGATVVVAPQFAYRLGGMWSPDRPLINVAIWQCLGMVIGVYGIGYLVAAADPVRHWPIVAVGLLGKIFGPIGFVIGAVRGELPWPMGTTIVFNDLIWWVPFAMILSRANKH